MRITYPHKTERIKVTPGTMLKVAYAYVADTKVNATKKRFWNRLPLFIYIIINKVREED